MAPIVTGAEEIACSTYDAYIGVHDAVQTLEERTKMALNAMEAIEEAINLSVDGTNASTSVPGTPGPAALSRTPSARVEFAPAPTVVAPVQNSGRPSTRSDAASNLPARGTVEPASSSLARSPPGADLAVALKAPSRSSPMKQTSSPVFQPASQPPLVSAMRAGNGSSSSSAAALPRQEATTSLAERIAGARSSEVPAAPTVRIVAGDQPPDGRQAASDERKPGEAKYREHSVASAFSEAESLGATHLQGY